LPEASGSFRCFVILRCGKLIAARLGNIALSEGQRVTRLGRSGLFRAACPGIFSTRASTEGLRQTVVTVLGSAIRIPLVDAG
jgi:hypothetical protein